MKILLTLLTLSLFSLSAVASVCGADGDETVAKIQAQKTCDEAITIVDSCYYGTSIDLQTTAAASTVCDAEYGGLATLSKSDKALRSKMEARCAAAYSTDEGSQNQAGVGFCNLRVAEFFNGLKRAEKVNN